MNRKILKAFLLMALVAHPTSDASAQNHDDIVDVARSAGQFSTLLAALDAAGLTHTIAGEGPFTVLAPTDEAFSRLPAGTVEDLLKPENKGRLQAILKYHVISGRVTASQVKNLRSAGTLEGQRVAVSHEGGQIKIDEATVSAADIQASNGVVHVIDAVLLPPEMPEGQREARQLMELAIERGVPLFNRGQTEACAAIYEVAATALLQMGDAIPQGAQRELRRSLRDSRMTHDWSDRAWTLRGALDETMRQMSRAMDR